jgi:hypothetical protein
MARASSSVLNEVTETTGPKISSWNTRIRLLPSKIEMRRPGVVWPVKAILATRLLRASGLPASCRCR